MVGEFLGSPQLLVGNFRFTAFHVNACTLSTLCAPGVAKLKSLGHDRCVSPAPNWVERGLPLVRPIAESLKRRLPEAIQLDDLIGAGRLALVERAHKYDPDGGLPFEAWARFVIRGAMIDSIKGAPFREAKYAEITRAPAGTLPSPEETAASSWDRQAARRALAALPARQVLLLALIYVEGLSLAAAARAVNLTPPEALKDRRKAIERLRRFGRRLSCAALEGELTDVSRLRTRRPSLRTGPAAPAPF